LGKSAEMFTNSILSAIRACHLNFQKGQWWISGHTSPDRLAKCQDCEVTAVGVCFSNNQMGGKSRIDHAADEELRPHGNHYHSLCGD
jgi:hypothetical protein